MAIRQSGLSYKALAAYLVDGSTWNRLKAIATKSRADGGLGLVVESSRTYKAIFHVAPSAIIETRPDSDLNFLKFLKGKEHVLYDLASKDLTQRPHLSQKSKDSVVALGDIDNRIKRAVLAEVIGRCFFILYWNGKHAHLAKETTWDELLEKATTTLLDLDLSDMAILRLGSTPQAVAAMVACPKT